MKAQRRKAALQNRAYEYGNRAVDINATLVYVQRQRAARGFEDGYRAAMKDMRKLLAECNAENKWHPVHDAMRRLQHVNHCVRVRVQKFLRPLR